MPCPPMDATVVAKSTQGKDSSKKEMSKNSDNGKKTMSKGAGKKSSWVAMGFYPSSSSSKNKNRAQLAAVATVTEGKNTNTDKSSSGSSKKKRSISISRSMTCAGSICSTKESSVLSRREDRAGSRSASSRSLRAPPDIADVDAVYAASAAAVSATSSFNSEATTAATSSSSSTTATTATSASSPLSSPASSSFGSSFRGGVQIRKLSGCYECHSVFDPRSFTAAAAAFPCSDCDEVFGKAKSLELHKATKHAVSELGPEDTSRNIVEIIFQSSWLGKQAPVCRIDRILKVQNSDRTVKRFEEYKEGIKERASGEEGKRNARCVADGNELLRFHCTTFTCSLGASGTALCQAPATQCKLCGIIRDGFRVDGDGRIATMATSGRAHDMAQGISDGEKKAMLVCRVVAGRVKKACSDTKPSEDCDYDSVSPSSEGVYLDLDELFVFNPRAILPCFVVIYSGY